MSAGEHSLAHEIFQCLNPSGWFAANDWLAALTGTPSREMQACIEAEGSDFSVGYPAIYAVACDAAGFEDIQVTDHNPWTGRECSINEKT